MSVTTQLVGGLGNQLFQYAAGRSLSLKLGQPLHLDIAPFKKYKLHHYALNHFNISAKTTHVNKLKMYLPKLFNLVYFKEKTFEYQPEIKNLSSKKDIYLEGYWQSEKYFSDIRPVLLKEFTLKSPLSSLDQEVFKKIKKSDISVSLHVRRSDYFNNKATLAIHGVCDIHYYQKAIEYLKENYKKFTIFVFSDDILWAKENIKSEFLLEFVEHNRAERNFADLFLISQCHHHIIANSSFSWWGAWLCENKTKTVVAPQKWFKDAGRNTIDLIPSDWIKI